ncbi:unnamed protein product, partial [Choristocarpus tenellus]
PFTEKASLLALARLPKLQEFCFDKDGSFGIDARRLVVGREIARGAYGVVHEAVLLEHPLGVTLEVDIDGEDINQHSEEMKGGKGTSENGMGGVEEEPPAKEVENHSRVLGEGEGGNHTKQSGIKVQKGNHQEGSGMKVAVKIQQVPPDEEEQANLIGELSMLRNQVHPHLVNFIGAAVAAENGMNKVMVAMEMCTNGALREALKLHLSWPLKVRIALDMTSGLQYLHEQGIIHRDIKTPNVLVDAEWRGKLCDYNFAIDESSSIKQARQTLS